jgi:hypothetical protein
VDILEDTGWKLMPRRGGRRRGGRIQAGSLCHGGEEDGGAGGYRLEAYATEERKTEGPEDTGWKLMPRRGGSLWQGRLRFKGVGHTKPRKIFL